MPGNRNINSSPAHGRGRGAGHRGRGRGRGRGGNGRGSGAHTPSRLQNVQSGSATIGLDGIDFEGDLASETYLTKICLLVLICRLQVLLLSRVSITLRHVPSNIALEAISQLFPEKSYRM